MKITDNRTSWARALAPGLEGAALVVEVGLAAVLPLFLVLAWQGPVWLLQVASVALLVLALGWMATANVRDPERYLARLAVGLVAILVIAIPSFALSPVAVTGTGTRHWSLPAAGLAAAALAHLVLRTLRARATMDPSRWLIAGGFAFAALAAIATAGQPLAGPPPWPAMPAYGVACLLVALGMLFDRETSWRSGSPRRPELPSNPVGSEGFVYGSVRCTLGADGWEGYSYLYKRLGPNVVLSVPLGTIDLSGVSAPDDVDLRVLAGLGANSPKDTKLAVCIRKPSTPDRPSDVERVFWFSLQLPATSNTAAGDPPVTTTR